MKGSALLKREYPGLKPQLPWVDVTAMPNRFSRIQFKGLTVLPKLVFYFIKIFYKQLASISSCKSSKDVVTMFEIYSYGHFTKVLTLLQDRKEVNRSIDVTTQSSIRLFFICLVSIVFIFVFRGQRHFHQFFSVSQID